MSQAHDGWGEIKLKAGVTREQILVEVRKTSMPFQALDVKDGVLEYEYSTKWPDYTALDLLKKFAAAPWVNHEFDEEMDDSAPPRSTTYSP